MDPARELLWLRRVRDVSLRMVDEHDLNVLLPQIVDAAIEITEAERGYLVLVIGKSGGVPKIKVKAARGFDKAALRADKNHISRTVVARIFDREGEGLVTTSEGDADVLEVDSVQGQRVLSIVCVPLQLRGEIRGVLYLDHRFEKGAFTLGDLAILRTFADQAALAIETAELRAGAGEADKLRTSLDELERLRAAAARPATSSAPQRLRFGGLVGASPAMAELYADVERVARSWDPVLIVGESGTGKELVAREIHQRGERSAEPFVTAICSGLADEALEGELFGQSDSPEGEPRPGKLRSAGRGTLFLNGISELSAVMQAKLLLALQEGLVRPQGGGDPQPFACRVLVAARRDLRAEVTRGAFREDLYYRLDVIRINVPPLRLREGDVPLLLQFVADQAGCKQWSVSPQAIELLGRYRWPGNVVELENEVRRLVTLAQVPVLPQHLSPEIRAAADAVPTGAGRTLAEVERAMVEGALRSCKGNKSQTARQLGIPRSTLYNLIERYGLG